MTKLIAATIVAGLMAVSVTGQSLVTVKVPFPFRVGDTELPAGAYEFEAVTANAIRITNIENRNMAVAFNPIAVTRSDQPEDSPKLIFNRYGADYYFSQMWPAGALTGRAVLKSGREAELARTIRPVRVESITASRR